jgi:hypothetical protein
MQRRVVQQFSMGYPLRIPNQRIKHDTCVEGHKGRVTVAAGTYVKYIAKHNLPYGHELGDYNEKYRKACYISREVGIALVDVSDLDMDAT